MLLDSILKYLSIITVAGAGISFIVGLLQYLDQRKREERTKRYEQFHDLMRRISAWSDETKRGLPLTQQVAAVYELQHFSDYSNVSLPILRYLRTYFEERTSVKLLLDALDETIDYLNKHE